MYQPQQSQMGFFRSRYENFIDFRILSKNALMIKLNHDIFNGVGSLLYRQELRQMLPW
jgi:hypothetical protein